MSVHNLTEEQFATIETLVAQFGALHESLPAQFESISNQVSQLGASIDSVERNLTERIISDINNVVNENQTAIRVLRQELEEIVHRSRLNLREEINRANESQNTTVPPVVPPTTTPLGKTLRLRKPTPFSGKASECDSFFAHLEIPFASDRETFEQDSAKILYAINNMTGDAFKYMEPYIKLLNAEEAAKPEILKSYNSFVDFIKHAFGDSNPVLNAETALRALRNTSTVAIYSTEFRRISMNLEWNDQALMSQYKYNLRNDVKEELAHKKPQPTTVDELIVETIDIDNVLAELGRERNRHSNNGRYNQNRNNHNYNNKNNNYNRNSNYSRNNYNNGYQPNRGNFKNNNQSSGPVPMDTSAAIIGNINDNNRSSSSLSPNEKQRHIQQGLCLYCGQGGHFQNKCPRKKTPFTNNKANNFSKNENVISCILTNEEGEESIKGTDWKNRCVIASISNKMTSESYNENAQNYSSWDDSIVYGIDSRLLVIKIELTINVLENGEHEKIRTLALIDSGATNSFISSQLVRDHCLPMQIESDDVPDITLANGAIIKPIKYTSAVWMHIAGTPHDEFIGLRHLDQAIYPVILGLNWLQRHQPSIYWNSGVVKLSCLGTTCSHCRHLGPTLAECLERAPTPMTVSSISSDESVYSSITISSDDTVDSPISISSDETIDSPVTINSSEDDFEVVPRTSPISILGDFEPVHAEWRAIIREIFGNNDEPVTTLSGSCNLLNHEFLTDNDNSDRECPQNNSKSSFTSASHQDSNIYDDISTSSDDLINYHYNACPTLSDPFPNDVVTFESLLGNNVNFLASIVESTNEITVPKKYHEYLSVFSKVEADRLPDHRVNVDHTIPLKPNATIPYGAMYSMSEVELKTLYDYIQENLAKGFIEKSESPAGAPVLFVKKKDGTLRLCVDYRGLNKITIPNRYPLPLISETLDRVRKGKIFTKFDLRGAYNLIRMAPGEEWKTAFRTRYGHFQYKVMPFGLCGAPGTFQAYMNDVLREYLDSFCVTMLDDCLIFSETQEEHDQHVKLVLEKFRQAKLSCKLEKCEFDVKTVKFLGYVISQEGIGMDPEKVQAVKDWKTPQNVHDIQVFLGFTNFYKRFIKNYSQKCVPLTALLKKDVKFNWTEETENAFKNLKTAILGDQILHHYDPDLPCIVETDSSDYALGAVLSQKDANGNIHPIAFHSRKLLPAERNYPIYDKELLAIIDCFKAWRQYLEFSRQTTTVITDHKNLEYFSTTRSLSRRQVRWAEFLSDYKFVIQYRPGKQNAAADALSRKDKPFEEGDTSAKQQKQEMTLLKPEMFVLASITQLPVEPIDDNIRKEIEEEIKDDAYFGPIYKDLKENRTTNLEEYTIADNLLLFKGTICVPNNNDIKRTILEEGHDNPAAGHFGITKTFDLVSRNYYWPGMRKYIKDYVLGCDTCIRNKNYHHKPYGLLQSLPIPDTPWTSISVDFITQLPPSGEYTAICVFVDRFSKMAIFAPTTNQVDAEGTCDLFMKYVFCNYGLPTDIVSDRGVTFTSKFTQAMMKSLDVKQKLSTAFHPQTDGQTERVNSILEKYLRCYINYQQSNWHEYLPIAQFAYNNSKHSSTDLTPFYAMYGYHPRLSVVIPQTAKDQTIADERIRHIHEMHELMKYNIKTAIEKHAETYNRKVIKDHKYEIGDKVWLSSKNIKSQRPTGKLDYKRLGPFKVIEIIGTRSYKLELPASMKIYPVFHTNLLEPYKPDLIEGRPFKEPPPVIVEEHEEYKVDHIVDSKIHRNKIQYLVHWKGYSVMDRTWEPIENLSHCQDLLDKFHEENPTRPKPDNTRSRQQRSRGAQPKRGGRVTN